MGQVGCDASGEAEGVKWNKVTFLFRCLGKTKHFEDICQSKKTSLKTSIKEAQTENEMSQNHLAH